MLRTIVFTGRFFAIQVSALLNRFCGEHFDVTAHRCPSYDESKHNRIAPSCPLCNQPVAIPHGQDPNIRMENHISNECSVMTGKSGRAKSAPVCARGKCGKVLFAPIRCDKCSQQFCPQHRFPKDHTCSSLSTPASSNSRITSPALAKQSISASSKASAASASAMNAMKKTLASASSNVSAHSPSTSIATPKIALPSTNMFSKADRRAKAERESRRKAMMERAKKGLLSDEEKRILATEEAQRAQQAGKKDGDCVMM
ncbi:hypothetical protein SERLADRAFT_470157 [Serpula lacrymans var. lacrymans S7.9]|uniref:AN1-type domain-containing protein n=1 Tax=Serpula lacrymans var. lacrymans (strain S7.9) TaxID=578457 RepID=F8NYY1_SERL9|nr:uncharacterized protein SERLADRAFT_470157 [Serpula lacrymans var. lacrymans S7.9]EGO23802.1 hypothetical protein SERLADRAFT_470157 [Serpula lacrymans var. lacrymans S7.9]